jgi:hypothetical protein
MSLSSGKTQAQIIAEGQGRLQAVKAACVAATAGLTFATKRGLDPAPMAYIIGYDSPARAGFAQALPVTFIYGSEVLGGKSKLGDEMVSTVHVESWYEIVTPDDYSWLYLVNLLHIYALLPLPQVSNVLFTRNGKEDLILAHPLPLETTWPIAGNGLIVDMF